LQEQHGKSFKTWSPSIKTNTECTHLIMKSSQGPTGWFKTVGWNGSLALRYSRYSELMFNC